LGRNVWLAGDPDRMCGTGAGCTECPAGDVAGSVSSRCRWGRGRSQSQRQSQRQSLRAMISWASPRVRGCRRRGGPRWPRPEAGSQSCGEPTMRGADHAGSRPCEEPTMRGAGRGGPDRPAWPRQAPAVGRLQPSVGTGRVVLKRRSSPGRGSRAERRPTKPRIRDIRGQVGRSGRPHPKTGQVVMQGNKPAISIGQFVGLANLAARLGLAPAPELPGAHSGDMAYPPGTSLQPSRKA
jgi:hypothetical protein